MRLACVTGRLVCLFADGDEATLTNSLLGKLQCDVRCTVPFWIVVHVLVGSVCVCFLSCSMGLCVGLFRERVMMMSNSECASGRVRSSIIVIYASNLIDLHTETDAHTNTHVDIVHIMLNTVVCILLETLVGLAVFLLSV